MERKASLKATIRKGLQERRDEINLAELSLTKESYLQAGSTIPLVIQPTMDGVNLASWAANNQDYIRNELAKHGAILFRNFGTDTPVKFESFARSVAVNGDLYEEYGDLPRDDPGLKVYHSTPYPKDKPILFHNESSHMHRWPMKIFFYSVKVAEQGGATPILDCRRTYQTIDPAIIKQMEQKKLLYVRNFIDGLDVSWQQFFQTSDKKRVEDYCHQASIDFEWKGENQLTTRQLCRAVVKHPHTGDTLFFNQIQLHHVSCLDPDVRASMLAMFREEDLPRNVYYGDGTRIEDSIVQEISALYEQQAIRFQWLPGDVILLDNMRIAHARDTFEGTRKVLVAMAEIVFQKDIQS